MPTPPEIPDSVSILLPMAAIVAVVIVQALVRRRMLSEAEAQAIPIQPPDPWAGWLRPDAPERGEHPWDWNHREWALSGIGRGDLLQHNPTGQTVEAIGNLQGPNWITVRWPDGKLGSADLKDLHRG